MILTLRLRRIQKLKGMVYMAEKLDTKSKNKISQELKDEIAAKLNELTKTNPCPRCGSNNFSVADGLVVHVLQDNDSALVLEGDSIFCAAVICDNCGYFSEHALGTLGITIEVDNDVKPKE